MSLMVSSPKEITAELGARLRARRLSENLTQKGLAERSGVALPTLRRFERTGQIGLEKFIKLAVALRDDAALEALLKERKFQSLDDVLEQDKKPQRGRIK